MKTQSVYKIAIIVLGVVMFSVSSEAQETNGTLTPAINKSTYRTAFGLRAGITSGLTIKHFVTEAGAIEGIAGVWPNSFTLTALYEHHVSAGAPGLYMYFGGGAHAAFGTGRIYYYENSGRRDFYRSGDVGVGMDGIIGIEYKIAPIPLAVSMDMKPFFEMNTNGRAYLSLDPGIGVKVAF